MKIHFSVCAMLFLTTPALAGSWTDADCVAFQHHLSELYSDGRTQTSADHPTWVKIDGKSAPEHGTVSTHAADEMSWSITGKAGSRLNRPMMSSDCKTISVVREDGISVSGEVESLDARKIRLKRGSFANASETEPQLVEMSKNTDYTIEIPKDLKVDGASIGRLVVTASFDWQVSHTCPGGEVVGEKHRFEGTYANYFGPKDQAEKVIRRADRKLERGMAWMKDLFEPGKTVDVCAKVAAGNGQNKAPATAASLGLGMSPTANAWIVR